MEKNKLTETSQIEGEIFSLLRRVINTVELYSSRLKDRTGINASQLSCMLIIYTAGPLSITKISEHVSLSPSMLTSIVDQLEKKELVVRSRKSSDRRVILIELTEKGKQLARHAPPSFQEQLTTVLDRKTGDFKKSLRSHLSQLLSIIVSEVLIDSALLGNGSPMVEVTPEVLTAEENQ
jgi:DNA-binding MarR family transcriptional regulator